MARVIGRNSSPELVAALQYSLSQAGFNPGPIDGKFGGQTERAVRSFQKANSLSVDGDPGPQTLGALVSKATFSGNFPRSRPQSLTMPGVSARINDMGTPNATALRQIGPRQATIGRPTMTGAFGPAPASGQASGRPISTMEFDPLTGNSGRGVGYTQLDLAGPLGAPAAPPPPNLIKQIYERLGGLDGRQKAPSISDKARGNSFPATVGGVPNATPVAGYPSASQLGKLLGTGAARSGVLPASVRADGTMTNVPNQRGASLGKVDSQLLDIIDRAVSTYPQRVEVYGPNSGYRAGDSRQHGSGNALDIQIFDASGNAIPNYQSAKSFSAYEQFAQHVRATQEAFYPDLSSALRWGGYFGGQIGKGGKYGAMDLMHFDLGGKPGLGMEAGSWARGLNPEYAKAWGVPSKAGSSVASASQSGGAIGRNSSPDVIAALQDSLARAGFNPGTIDGKMGSQTSTAVSAFQSANGLIRDGVAGPQTLRALATTQGTRGALAYGNNQPAQPSSPQPQLSAMGRAPAPKPFTPAPSPQPQLSAMGMRPAPTGSNFASRVMGGGAPISAIGGSPAPRQTSPNAAAAAAFAKANEKAIWGPMASRPSSTLGYPGAQPNPTQSRALTGPSVPGVTPRPVQTAQILKPTPVRTIPISLSLPPTLSGMTGTAMNAGKAKDDYLGPPTIAPPPLPSPTARLPQSRPAQTSVRPSAPSLPTNFNRQVAELQSMLNLAGVRDFTGSALKVDGLMGPRTQSAVIAAQGGMARPSVSAPRVPTPMTRSDSSASRGGNINPASGAPRGSISGSVGGSGRITTGAMR